MCRTACGVTAQVLQWRPRGASESEVQHTQYLTEVLCPLAESFAVSRAKLHPSMRPRIAERRRSRSLRQLAREYGVSHEAIRRACLVAEA